MEKNPEVSTKSEGDGILTDEKILEEKCADMSIPELYDSMNYAKEAERAREQIKEGQRMIESGQAWLKNASREAVMAKAELKKRGINVS